MAKTQKGFTLVELIVTIFIVSVALVAVMGGIRSLGVADVKAHEAELLQQFAAQKLADLRTAADLNNAETSGNFSDQGYAGVTFQVTVQPSGTDNVDEVKVTVLHNNEAQSLTELMFVPPAPTTSTTTGATTTPGRGVKLR
ncbi:MAG: type II secretion system protein [Armatimonadetes bacterium]|nr:type II secretion system protein [Armatimonadota bacterium]